MPNIIWPPLARVRTTVPAMFDSFLRRSTAISSLDRERLSRGTSLRVMLPVFAPLRQPPPPKLSSWLTISGTAALTISVTVAKVLFITSRRVPTSISTVTRTSFSSVAGMNSVPTRRMRKRQARSRAPTLPRTRTRWSRALWSSRLYQFSSLRNPFRKKLAVRSRGFLDFGSNGLATRMSRLESIGTMVRATNRPIRLAKLTT